MYHICASKNVTLCVCMVSLMSVLCILCAISRLLAWWGSCQWFCHGNFSMFMCTEGFPPSLPLSFCKCIGSVLINANVHLMLTSTCIKGIRMVLSVSRRQLSSCTVYCYFLIKAFKLISVPDSYMLQTIGFHLWQLNNSIGINPVPLTTFFITGQSLKCL